MTSRNGSEGRDVDGPELADALLLARLVMRAAARREGADPDALAVMSEPDAILVDRTFVHLVYDDGAATYSAGRDGAGVVRTLVHGGSRLADYYDRAGRRLLSTIDPAAPAALN